MRRLIDNALTAGRKRLSPQTGWVHFCYESDGARHDTIPVFENFCFILALFRSRLSDDILLGKEMLEKLLAFEASGHFPIYLHEYPHIRDRSLSLDLLPIFYHLKREFSPVLGESLVKRLKELIGRILTQEENTSYGRRAKRLAALGKFQIEPGRAIASSLQLGEEILALQVQEGYTEADLAEITQFWHSGLQMYCGPYAREMQEGFETAPTLFDLFMGRVISPDHPLSMRGSLVYPLPLSLPAKEEDHLWIADPSNKAVHLFWRNGQMTHSLVIQGATHWEKLGDDRFAIDCTLTEEGPKEGEEKNEVSCYFNYHPDHEIRVDGERASAFKLEQKLFLRSPPIDLVLQASVLEGVGSFYGHLLRGNRSRQTALRGEKRFSAYDWQIALRTVARKGPCTLRILVSLSY